MEAVASVRALTWLERRVYVVDNASSDGSEAMLRAWAPDLTVIQSGGNLGWAGGNNVGIRAAQDDGCMHVLLLNNDAMIHPDALTILADAAASHPEAASIGALIVSADDPQSVEFAGSVIDPRHTLPIPREVTWCELDALADLLPTVAVKGCAMLLTATGLSKVGLLTEDYFLNYDETDWCFRANALGLGHIMAMRAVVEHKGAVSFAGFDGPLYRYFITRNRLVFANRHLGFRGRWFAWRSAFWQIRQPPAPPVTWFQSSLVILMAVRDYGLGRLGDCPPRVRAFNRLGQRVSRAS